jgi:hypothetical protein
MTGRNGRIIHRMRLRDLALSIGIAALLAPAVLAGEPEARAEAKPEATTAEKPKTRLRCEPVTGSFLRPNAKKSCSSPMTATGPFRSYSSEKIELTGVDDLNAALKKLDPAFR